MTRIFFVLILLLIAVESKAQNSIRQQIDRERSELKISYQDEKTYNKARNFIRRDSTYYVGYLLEGAFYFFRANDELGFNKASIPLKKAFEKIENDYDALLRMRTNNFADYSANYRFQTDYGLITYFLNRCYQSIEDQDNAMEVVKHMRDRNLQLEFNLDSYNTMAWMYHRNRMYTSKRFSFLKNSVMENVQAANQCLDSALRKIKIDLPLNNGLFDPRYVNQQYLSTYHYKAMIHDYLLNIDSANYYYDVLIQNNRYSANNYANFKLAMGELERADRFFKEASQHDNGTEKNTKEYYYMRGTLNIYRGHPEQADTLLSTVIQQQGSTPGFGWHSIGLARALHYEGLTAESQARINKAARFQELHIGTTWGQEQYNLAIASLHYLNQLHLKKEYWFEHNEWYFWLNPMNWYRWLKYTLEIRHQKMLLAALVAENPERDQIIYSLFSPENLMSFDEVWSVMEGFGNEYFIGVYKKKLATDKRPRLKKYFNYVLGKLYLAEGKEDEAIRYFERVMNDPEANDPYEKLLLARTYEGLAHAYGGAKSKNFTQRLYATYPQLIPFSDLKIEMQLNTSGNISEEYQPMMDQLKRTTIDFTSSSNIPQINISFTPRGKAVDIAYSVQVSGETKHQATFRVEKNEFDTAGLLIAYHLFGIPKTKIGEIVPVAPPPINEKEKSKKTA